MTQMGNSWQLMKSVFLYKFYELEIYQAFSLNGHVKSVQGGGRLTLISIDR